MEMLLFDECVRRQQSREALAATLETSQRRLERIERQEQGVTLAELERWAQALQVHPFDLVHFDGVPEPRRCLCCCHRWTRALRVRRRSPGEKTP